MPCRRRSFPSASRCSPAKRRSPKSGIGSKGHFPGPLFLAPPPLEIEWADRIKMAEMAAANADTGYPDLLRVAREYAAAHGAVQVRHHRRRPRRAFRHRRLADLAQHRLRVRRQRHPARHGSDPARRMRSGAGDRRRRFADAGIAGALLAALGAVDPKRSAGARLKTVLEKPRRLRAGGRRRGAGARKPRPRARARRPRPRHPRRRRRKIRIRSTAPARAPTASRSSPPCTRRSPTPASGPRTSTTSTPTAPRRRRTTRWSISASPRCSASASAAFRSRPTNR